MKTNKEKNQEFDAKQKERVRPKGPTYNWQPLEAVIRQWITGNK
jgi:hypothetical protein